MNPGDSPGRWEVTNARCGCGGQLYVDHFEDIEPAFAYETFCEKCLACDPNGWGSLDECLANVAYFSG